MKEGRIILKVAQTEATLYGTLLWVLTKSLLPGTCQFILNVKKKTAPPQGYDQGRLTFLPYLGHSNPLVLRH